MIEIKYLTTGYGRHIVSRNINERLERGELVCLLGANGIGKSTLLRILCGFLPPLEGEIIIEGKNMKDTSPHKIGRLVGVVLTERIDVRQMKVKDIVAMGRNPYTGFWGSLNKEDLQQVEQAMQQAGIDALKERMIHTLSDGERQKTMIAKALAQQTPVIILDEPTAFLDYTSKIETLRLLHRLAHETGKVIFMSTHDVEVALQLSDRLWLMKKNGIQTGTPRELAENGCMAQFVECEGVHFNAKELTLKIEPTIR